MNQKNRNDILVVGLWNYFKVYLYLIFIFTLFRIFFVYYYGDLKLLENNTGDFLQAFLLGFRYDTLVISYILLPFILLHLLVAVVGSVKIYNFINFLARFYIGLMVLVVVVLLVSDMGFYNYFQDHINILFYGIIEDDTAALFETLSKNYPLELAVGLILAFFLFSFWLVLKLLPKMSLKNSIINAGFGKFILFACLFLLIYVGALRGGYGIMVISPKYSDISDVEFINQASLNGIITLEKAIKLRAMGTSENYNLAKQFGYGSNIHQAFSDYLGMDVSYTESDQLFGLITRKTSMKDQQNYQRPHVVLFVMESFGGHWGQFNSPEFNFLAELKKHFDQDYYFPYTISSDNGTIGSLMTIATNIPNRPGARFLSESRYMQLPLKSSTHIPFQTAGYQTNFFYGGKLGWRDIGKYFRYQNYDELHGENSIKKSLNLTGRVGTEWGVYDEHLFNAIHAKLASAKKPQFILALSTTNHPPFEVPENYPQKKLIIPDALKSKITREMDIFKERFKAFEYSNQKLGEFISHVKASALAHNTIIAITGDHNFWGFMNYSKEEAYSKHTVPMYFYIPPSYIPKGEVDLNKVGSHKDIATTLYELALDNIEYLSFGVDMFGKSKNYAFNTNIYADQNLLIIKGAPYEWSEFPLIKKAEADEHAELRKAYRSTLSIADYFLRKSLEEVRKKSD